MKLTKHVDTSKMVEDFLKKNEVEQCPDYQKGFDKPLNSTVKYEDNYSFYGGNIPKVNGRNYDPEKEKEHITGTCRACKKPSKFYVVNWRKPKSNRKRYSTLCEDCSLLDSATVAIMSSFKNVEEYNDFVSRHGKYGNYTKYTLKELKELLPEAQNHSTLHTKKINEVIDLGKYKEEEEEITKTVNTDPNKSVLGHEFDF